MPALEAETGLRRTRVELMLKQLAVDGAVERVEGGWLPHRRAWAYDAEHYDGIVAVRRREADIMRAYTRGERCLMQLLQESLDDPTAAPVRSLLGVHRAGCPPPLEAAPSLEVARAVSTGAARARRTCSSRARCGRAARSAAGAGSRPS